MIAYTNLISHERFTLSLSFFLIFALPVFGESILLRNGGTIKGKVTNQDQTKITLEKSDGTTVSVLKTEILKVVYKDNISKEEENKLRKAEEEKERAKKEKDLADAQSKAEAERLAKEKADAQKLEEEKKKEEDRLAKEAKEKQNLVSGSSLSRTEAVLSSMVLPGFGQYKQKRKFAAILYPTLFLGSAFLTYQKYRMYQNSLNDYNNLSNPYSDTGLLKAALGVPEVVTPPSNDPVQALIANETSQFKQQRDAVEEQFREFQTLGAITLGIYLWNIVDTFLFHPKPALANHSRSWEFQNGWNAVVDFKSLPTLNMAGGQRWETMTRFALEHNF